MFKKLVFEAGVPIALQIEKHIKNLILKGMLHKGEKLPSTRELSSMLKVSRNSILKAYESLTDDGFIRMETNVGAFVLDIPIYSQEHWELDWTNKLSKITNIAEELDVINNTKKTENKPINFRGVSPDRELFDIDSFKRAFSNIISKEGHNLLNYGYAKGYKPLIDYLMSYMASKGIDTEDKDMVITNGFTEGFGVVLSTICEKGDTIICENPTHNTALKIMKMHELNIFGVDMDSDGINAEQLRETLDRGNIKAGFMIPSYHNPTGIVTALDKRLKIYNIFKEHNVPIIEDGFSEELKYSGAHIPSLAALAGKGKGVIYIGSFSKILFPGIRIGWILADKKLIPSLESVKKCNNIHTSFLDQAILYQYLLEGNLEKCIKKSRKIYKDRYSFALECTNLHIPNKRVSGDGGMYIFIELDHSIDTRRLLDTCCENGVVFMPGDIFHVNNIKKNTMRLSFANVPMEDIQKGIKIIGEIIRKNFL